MRGEYSLEDTNTYIGLELPPRARRIRQAGAWNQRGIGTTSACAENTCGGSGDTCGGWNYLRVRGEYKSAGLFYKAMLELPPRARRIPAGKKTLRRCAGTTSACAENTIHWPATPRARGNYLRVRGEYWIGGLFSTVMMELPPRARRILDSEGA